MKRNHRIRLLEKEQILRRYEKQLRRNVFAEPGVHDFVIVLDNLKRSFNIGKIFRSADAMGAAAVHLIGTDYFDPGPAKGSLKWVPAFFHKDFSACHEKLQATEHAIFLLSPENGLPAHEISFPRRSAFVFGHEEFGVSFNKEDFPGIRELSIPQFGKVQSLNVSIAASIVMYEYVRQHNNN